MDRRKLVTRTLEVVLLGGLMSAVTIASAQPTCTGLPSHSALKSALRAVVTSGGNGGLGNHMWATVVNRDGQVCAVVFSGAVRSGQWLLSRIISAQKANTANGLSLNGVYPNLGIGRAIATGNLYGVNLEGGNFFGLQHSNPVDTAVAYGAPGHVGGNPIQYGQRNDPLVGQFVGGVNVFGGGLGLYDESSRAVGGLGVSGDTSCTDHIVAWRVRDALGLDNIPGGVAPDGTDNLIINDPPTPNTFEQPPCGLGEDTIVADLPANFPIGP